MTSITRRIFLQSAFASSVALATERLGNSSWLQSTANQIRVATVGLGSAGYEHLAIFASIPGARIVTLYDPDMHRLRKAASFLRERGYPPPDVTTQLAKLVNDPSIDAISLACPFPSSLAPLSTLLAANKPLLFDSPSVNNFEDALATNRKIALSGSILRSRLADRLAPDSQYLCPNSPALRWIGTPLQAFLTAAPLKNGTFHLDTPAVACIDLLLASSISDGDRLSLVDHPVLSKPHVSSTSGSIVIEFLVNDSFLRRIQVDNFAVPTSSGALLQLRGRSGYLSSSASTRAHGDASVRTFIEFLTAIRVPPIDGNSAVQRAYLSAGLGRLVAASQPKEAATRPRSK
jgi:hypothetical protein